MIREHDRVVLDPDAPEHGLVKGDVGTVVHVYRAGEAFEVEFLTLSGETVGVITVVCFRVFVIGRLNHNLAGRRILGQLILCSMPEETYRKP
jgi:hypothetical protein